LRFAEAEFGICKQGAEELAEIFVFLFDVQEEVSCPISSNLAEDLISAK
jgi:hypothetical protein